MVRFQHGTPQAVWYSQHEYGQAMAYSAVDKIGKRPVAFSARGSHANYLTGNSHDLANEGMSLSLSLSLSHAKSKTRPSNPPQIMASHPISSTTTHHKGRSGTRPSPPTTTPTRRAHPSPSPQPRPTPRPRTCPSQAVGATRNTQPRSTARRTSTASASGLAGPKVPHSSTWTATPSVSLLRGSA
jgi:hypothetical protein